MVSADVIADSGSPVVTFGYTFTVQSGSRVALGGWTDTRGGRAATGRGPRPRITVGCCLDQLFWCGSSSVNMRLRIGLPNGSSSDPHSGIA